MLTTAHRRNYETDLKWIIFENNVAVAVTKGDGSEVPINNEMELQRLYTPEAHGEFSMYAFRESINKTASSKTSQKPMTQKPKEEKKEEKKAPEKVIDTELVNKLPEEPFISNNEKFSDIMETVYELQIYRENEILFVMEFEDYDDLLYRKNKLTEKYKNVTMYIKTLRSIVSYVKI